MPAIRIANQVRMKVRWQALLTNITRPRPLNRRLQNRQRWAVIFSANSLIFSDFLIKVMREPLITPAASCLHQVTLSKKNSAGILIPLRSQIYLVRQILIRSWACQRDWKKRCKKPWISSNAPTGRRNFAIKIALEAVQIPYLHQVRVIRLFRLLPRVEADIVEWGNVNWGTGIARWSILNHFLTMIRLRPRKRLRFVGQKVVGIGRP